MNGMILDGHVQVGQFTLCTKIEESVFNLTEIQINTIYFDLAYNRANKPLQLVRGHIDNGILKIYRDFGIGIISAIDSVWVNTDTCSFKNGNFISARDLYAN
ncbi:MAG TPA: hypothetical protein VKN14_03095 [Flavobacteriaceae bacterium]|nr:hypothetical protein [Flavobacteriaceae bacterium]